MKEHLCIVSCQHKYIKPHFQNKDKGGSLEWYGWQSVYKFEMLGITTYIIVIIIAKFAYLRPNFLIIRHRLCRKIGKKEKINSEAIGSSEGITVSVE